MQRVRIGVFGSLLAVGLLAAGVASPGDEPTKPESSVPVQVEDPAPAKTVAQGNTAFAVDLYGKLREQPGNLFLSPYSISTALAMAYGGARGETAGQMEKVLHFNLPAERLHAGYDKLTERILTPSEQDAYTLNVANALWGQQGYPFQPDYLELTKEHYGAGFRQIDFRTNPEGARQTINAWVEKQTRDKIQDLLPKGAITELSRLVLTNAIYFKGLWAEPFKEERTRPLPFHVTAEKQVEAPMMYQEHRFPYMQGDGFQALAMPYEGKDVRMVVLLPKTVDGLPALEQKLSAENLRQWTGQLRTRKVRVFLPRFKMTSKFSLGRTLQELGMTDAFAPGKADFTGISSSGDLFIHAALHKAFVEVNEEGTEAAAATGIVVGVTSVQPQPAVFRADRPFLFLITHEPTGSVLFMGRVVDPSEGK